jgi:hypothetical protein
MKVHIIYLSSSIMIIILSQDSELVLILNLINPFHTVASKIYNIFIQTRKKEFCGRQELWELRISVKKSGDKGLSVLLHLCESCFM